MLDADWGCDVSNELFNIKNEILCIKPRSFILKMTNFAGAAEGVR